MKRRDVLSGLGLGAAAFATAGPVWAQSGERQLRIALLHPGSVAIQERVAAIREGIAALRAPDRFILSTFLGGGDVSRLPALAAEAAASTPDVVLAVSRPAVSAIMAVAPAGPIVALDLESDPVESGWVQSLARPGGGTTGIFLDLPGLSAKCLELLREAVPGMKRVGVLWDRAMGTVPLGAVRASAEAFALDARIIEVGRSTDFDAALSSAAGQVDGILTVPSPLFGGHPKLLADLASAKRLAAITPFPDFGRAGGLLAYGPELQHLFRQAGSLAGRVAEGKRPQDTPVERPVRFSLVANQATARVLGLHLPTPLLARADEVIE